MKQSFFICVSFLFCTTALSAECPIGTTPAKYVQLEYIESTGTQYIDTGYIPAIGTKFTIKAKMLLLSSTQVFGGSAISGHPLTYFSPIVVGNSGRYIYYFNSYNTVNNIYINNGDLLFGSIEAFDDHAEILLNKNGDNYTFSRKGVLNAENKHIFLFSATNYIEPSAIIMYESQIYQHDVLVRDFVPAMRLGDGKPGMYDKVSGNFFTNTGTGEFIAGPEVSTEFMTFNKCNPCWPNTYKDFVGDGECTPCPDTLISPSGSKSVSECGRVLHIGDKIYHMKSVKQTSPSLHIRDENGNIWYGNLYSEQE